LLNVNNLTLTSCDEILYLSYPNATLMKALDSAILKMVEDQNKFMKPFQSTFDLIEKSTASIPKTTLEYLNGITDAHGTGISQSLRAVDILSNVKDWTSPAQIIHWQSFYHQIDQWNENMKPLAGSLSILSDSLQQHISSIDSTFKHVAHLLQPMKPLSIQFEVSDFINASLSEMDLSEADEVKIELGIEEVTTFLRSVGVGTFKTAKQFERRVSAFELKLVDKFKGHPLLVVLFGMIFSAMIGVLGSELYASYKTDVLQTTEAPKKLQAPKKKKIVYDKESNTKEIKTAK